MMNKYSTAPPQPAAPNAYDQDRWEHSALRRRLLLSSWENDIINTMSEHLPSDRMAAWGPPDRSSNPFKAVVGTLSVLYSSPPRIIHPAQEEIQPLLDLFKKGALWPLMQRVQQLVIGMRESFVRVGVSKGKLTFRSVPSDLVIAHPDPDDPGQPIYLAEYRLRVHPIEKKQAWFIDEFDLRGSEATYRILEIKDGGKIGEDFTKEILGVDQSGSNYPYLDEENNPILPYVIYHAEVTGELWDPWTGSELVWGSLNSALHFSMFSHCLKSASYPQRYMAGLLPAGVQTKNAGDSSRRWEVVTDPASVLILQSDPDSAAGQGMVGQWTAGVDISGFLSSIQLYEQRVAINGGIAPGELIRTKSDPRSAAALSISRAGQRECARKFAQTAIFSDEQLIRISALMATRYLGLKIPTDNYSITYSSLPLSPEERKGLLDDVKGKLADGLISPVDALVELYGYSREEAIRQLQKIRTERAQFT